MAKILVLNPSPASLDPVLGKANIQHSKNGPFEAVLLLGDVLPKSSTSLPSTQLELPAYFTEGAQGMSDLVTNSESLTKFCANLKYLEGLTNTITLESGIIVMFVSGAAELLKGGNKEYAQSVDDLIEGLGRVDVLVTYNWPRAIAVQEKLTLVGNSLIDRIVTKVTPQYHFCVGHELGKFFENPPFKWENGAVTRFISLAQEGSGSKWFYAFNIDSKQAETKAIGTNPFTAPKTSLGAEKRSLELESTQNEIQPIAKKARVVSPADCFFCLSNPKIETHMIISIGKHSYLTVAKGPLTRSNKNLNFSGHSIIIPIEHVPTLGQNKTDTNTYKEMEEYQKTLADAFHKNTPFYRLVTFEINRKSNVHHNVQVLPVHEDQLDKFSQSLHEKARYNNEHYQNNQSLKFREFSGDDKELAEIINQDGDYLLFQILHPNSKKVFLCELKEPERMFDFQFPRRVLAHTLRLPKRVYWDKCQQTKAQETIDCEEFKKFYGSFDFTA